MKLGTKDSFSTSGSYTGVGMAYFQFMDHLLIVIIWYSTPFLVFLCSCVLISYFKYVDYRLGSSYKVLGSVQLKPDVIIIDGDFDDEGNK